MPISEKVTLKSTMAEDLELYQAAYNVQVPRQGYAMGPMGEDSELERLTFNVVKLKNPKEARVRLTRQDRDNLFIPSDFKFASLVDRSADLDLNALPRIANALQTERMTWGFGLKFMEGNDLIHNLVQVLGGPLPTMDDRAKSLAELSWQRKFAKTDDPGLAFSDKAGLLTQIRCLHNYGVVSDARITVVAYQEQPEPSLFHLDIGTKKPDSRAFVILMKEEGKPTLRVLEHQVCETGRQPKKFGNAMQGYQGIPAEFPPTGAKIWLESDSTGPDERIPVGTQWISGSIPCVAAEPVDMRVTASQHDNSFCVRSLTQLRMVTLAVHGAGKLLSYLDLDCQAGEKRSEIARKFVLSQVTTKTNAGDRSNPYTFNIQLGKVGMGSITLPPLDKVRKCRRDVYPISPMGFPMHFPLFTLKYPVIEIGGKKSLEIREIFIDSQDLVFVAASDLARKGIVILAGECGTQCLDDMYVSMELPNSEYQACSFGYFESKLSCVVIFQQAGKTRLNFYQYEGTGSELAPFKFVKTVESSILKPKTNCVALGADAVRFAEKGSKEFYYWAPGQPNPNDKPGSMESKAAVARLVSTHGRVVAIGDKGEVQVLGEDASGLKNRSPTWPMARWLVPDDGTPVKPAPGPAKGELVEGPNGNAVEGTIAALEVDNRLYIFTERQGEYVYYHPAMRNVLKRANILSMYYRFKHHCPKHSSEGVRKLCITCMIDLGIQESVRRTFASGTYPGVYVKEEKGEYQAEDRYVVTDLQVYFNNGLLPVGLDCHRTICQLIASFCCASRARVFGPGMAHRMFYFTETSLEPCNVERYKTELFALYGTLLSVAPRDLDLAIDVLENTRRNKEHFAAFLERVRNP